MKKYIIAAALSILSIGLSFNFASAQTVTTTGVTSSCVNLTSDLYLAMNDVSTNGQVTMLQNFLISQKLPKNNPSSLAMSPRGYFGSMTYIAVQDFQAQAGIITTSSSAGMVGPATRAAIKAASGCNSVAASSNTTNVSGYVAPAVSFAKPVLGDRTPYNQFVTGGSQMVILPVSINTIPSGVGARITELGFSTTGTDAIESVTVGDVTRSIVGSATTTISGLNIPVTGGMGAYIPVTVKFSGFAYSATGGMLQSGVSNVSISLAYIHGVTDAGQAMTSYPYVTSSPMTLVASKPTVTVSRGGTDTLVLGQENKIGEFTVSADANGSIAVGTTSLSLFSNINNLSVSSPRVAIGIVTVPIAFANVNYINSAESGASYPVISLGFSPNYEISAGQSKTFSVYAKVDGTATPGSSISINSNITSSKMFSWKDLLGGNITYTGEKILNFPTDSYFINGVAPAAVTSKPYVLKETASLILKMIVGLIPVDSRYDVNGDKVVNNLDSIELLKGVSSFPTNFPVEPKDIQTIIGEVIVGLRNTPASTDPVFKFLDADKNGIINLNDSILVAKIAVGLVDPASPTAPTFSASIASGAAPLAVTFYADKAVTSCPSNSPYAIDFGDGQMGQMSINMTNTTSSGGSTANTSGSCAGYFSMHIYNQAGNYVARLINASNGLTVGTSTVSVTSNALYKPTASITANGSHSVTLAVGETATANWSSTNGTYWNSLVSTVGNCPNAALYSASTAWKANSVSGASILNGNTGNAGCTSYITYMVSNSYGVATDTLEIITKPVTPAPTLQLTANPIAVKQGAASLINWRMTGVTNINQCSVSSDNDTAWISNWNLNKIQNAGLGTSPLSKTTTYSMLCRGDNGQNITATTTVTVDTSATPTVTITAPDSVSANSFDSFPVTWSATGVTSCTKMSSPSNPGWTGSVSTLSGDTSMSRTDQVYSIASPTTLTLYCAGQGGTVMKSVTVNVASLIPSVTLSADSSSVDYGQSTSIRWSSTNTSYCTLTSGSLDDFVGDKTKLSGSISTGPLTSQKMVTISCAGGGTTVSKSIVIGVNQTTTTVTCPTGSILTSANTCTTVPAQVTAPQQPPVTPDVTPTAPTATPVSSPALTPPATNNTAPAVAPTVSKATGSITAVFKNSIKSGGSYVAYLRWATKGATKPMVVTSKGMVVSTSVSSMTTRVPMSGPEETFILKDGDAVLGSVTVCPTTGCTSPQALALPSDPFVLGASTSVYCADIARNLHRGDESASTKKLQSFLNSAGYLKGEVTGFYGDKTVEAVKAFQSSKGLPVTGMVYDFTRQAIKAESCQ